MLCLTDRSKLRAFIGVVLAAVSPYCLASDANAEPLRVFPGQYIVTLPTASTVHGSALALASSPFIDLDPQHGQVKEVLSSDTVLIAGVPGVMVAGQVAALSMPDADGAVPYEPQNDYCKQLLATGDIASCSPNYLVSVFDLVPDDPSYQSMWGLSDAEGISAARAWDLSTGSDATVVAVIDTGVDYTHPDLAANIWVNPGEIAANGIDDDGNGYIDDLHGINAVDGALNPGNPFDDHYHGTHVAGTIGAVGNNGVGVVGVNHRVKIMALKFIAASGSGQLADAIKAIDYMVNMKVLYGINVLVSNNSWGGGGYSLALQQAIQRARSAGIIFVAAAGNEASDTDAWETYPAAYEVDNVVSVAALGQDQRLASFSNYGESSVDIAAPGDGILSTLPANTYGNLSGTSMATPHVAGALALLFAREPGLSFLEAIDRLYLTGRELPSLYDSARGVPLVRTQRTLNVARMLYKEASPLPTPIAGSEPCRYDLQFTNLINAGDVDTSADEAPIINQVDEGEFYSVDLPFTLPFFRTSTNKIWISPNGTVYSKEPTGFDYRISARAPMNSIAGLHTDLIPRAADQGVRVQVALERVTIMWRSEHYNFPGQGVITLRTTIFKSGAISTSVFFEGADSGLTLRAKVLGNPFSSPQVEPVGVVGITGSPISTFSSTANLFTVQQGLISSSSELLALGGSMSSLCSVNPPDPSDDDPLITVSSINLRKGRRGPNAIRLNIGLEGTGTGSVPVTFAINDVTCNGEIAAQLVNGSKKLSAKVPNRVARLVVRASEVEARARFNVSSSAPSTARIARLCTKLLNSVMQ